MVTTGAFSHNGGGLFKSRRTRICCSTPSPRPLTARAPGPLGSESVVRVSRPGLRESRNDHHDGTKTRMSVVLGGTVKLELSLACRSRFSVITFVSPGFLRVKFSPRHAQTASEPKSLPCKSNRSQRSRSLNATRPTVRTRRYYSDDAPHMERNGSQISLCAAH